MKKLLLITIFAFFFIAKPAFAALPATGVIEIRSSATAGNLNGGGFNSARGGTDYTLQNAAQEGRADGASVTTSTTFTSALATFTDAMKGNYLHITTTGTGAQCIIGWYEVVSVTDADNVVLDRAPSAGTGCVAATWALGGALSLGASGTSGDDDVFEMGVAGNQFWIKSATYTMGEVISISTAGGASKPIRIDGYNSTRDDKPAGTNRPLIINGANAFTLAIAWFLSHVRTTATATIVVTTANGTVLNNVKVENISTSEGRSALNISGTDGSIINCEIISYRGIGISGGGTGMFFGNYFHNSISGVRFATGVLSSFSNNIVEGMSSSSITFSGVNVSLTNVTGNTLYGSENKLGFGVWMFSGTTDIRFLNNIVYGFVTGVHHQDTQSIGYDNYNDYYNNTNDVTSAGQWQKGANSIAVNPSFTNVSQVTGTAGAFVAGNNKLVDTTKDFTAAGVVAGDAVLITAGTGAPNPLYYFLIDSITTTTNANDTLNITIPAGPGTDTTADKVYQITTGHNFLPTGGI